MVRRPNAGFAIDESEPIAYFAGIWGADWSCVRKITEGLVTCDFYGFRTTEPNGVVAPIHPKAMPVILSTSDEVNTRLTAPWEQTTALQQPMPDEKLVKLTA